MSAAPDDRHDVVDRGRQGVGAFAPGINGMPGISADAAQPVVAFTDLAHAERFDRPICPDESPAALVLSTGGH